jgi:hypothetical protein
MDPMKVRFLREHCWDRIRGKENQKSCKAEGVAVLEIDSGSLEVKGTKAGRKEMIIFLEKLAANVYSKVRMSSAVKSCLVSPDILFKVFYLKIVVFQ